MRSRIGARRLARCSSEPAASSGSPIALQNDRTMRVGSSGGSLLSQRGVQLYLAALLLLSLVAAFLPLADHLGYEASELVALLAGSLGAAPGIAGARQEARAPA